MGGVIVRPWAEFASDLPQDVVDNEGDIVQDGGKSVAEAIHAVLGRLGCELEPVSYAPEHGWDFHFRYKKRRLWCQVTLIDDYIALFKDTSLVSDLFGWYHPDYQEILTSLGRELQRHSRFRNVRWYFDHQVLSGAPGAEAPVAAA